MTDGAEALDAGLRAELEHRFGQELAERLPRMRLELATLLTVEGAPADAAVSGLAGLARDAHSIKGGAQLVGRREIARVAEVLEGHFGALAGAERPVRHTGRHAPARARALAHSQMLLDLLDRLAAGEAVAVAEIDRSIRSHEPADG